MSVIERNVFSMGDIDVGNSFLIVGQQAAKGGGQFARRHGGPQPLVAGHDAGYLQGAVAL